MWNAGLSCDCGGPSTNCLPLKSFALFLRTLQTPQNEVIFMFLLNRPYFDKVEKLGWCIYFAAMISLLPPFLFSFEHECMNVCVLCVHVRVRARAFVCVSLCAVSCYPRAHQRDKIGWTAHPGAHLSAAPVLGQKADATTLCSFTRVLGLSACKASSFLTRVPRPFPHFLPSRKTSFILI